MTLLFTFVQYRISTIFQLAFLLLFLPRRYKKLPCILTACAAFAVISAINFVSSFVLHIRALSLAVPLISTVVVLGVAFILSRYRDWRALFTGMVAATYVMSGDAISSIVHCQTLRSPLSLACQILIHLFLLLLFARKLRRHYMLEMETSATYWSLLCAIPTLFYTAVYSLVYWPESIYVEPDNSVSIVIILLLMCTTYFIITILFAKQREEDYLERSNESLKTYAECLRRETQTVQRLGAQTAVMRHDMRHYANLISAYLDVGETAKIRGLLQQMNVQLDRVKPKHYCENVAVNGILSYYEEFAEQNRVKFLCEADVPQNLKINEFEFATVLSNLLENALRAAKKTFKNRERFVRVKAKLVKERLMLEVSNSYAGKCEFLPATGLPVSHNGEGHGYGLRSVQTFAQNNGALFDCLAEDDVFCVRLLFPK